MLRSKDPAGFLAPLASVVDGLRAVAIPGEAASLDADALAEAARSAGIEAEVAPGVEAALRSVLAAAPGGRVLICGSLYLAGRVLRENG
jgi:dihydrofolate synthase/folylpolyglutamate synthase